MVYITSISIIKTQYIHSPIFRRRPIYTHQNGNINTTSYESTANQPYGLILAFLPCFRVPYRASLKDKGSRRLS